MESIGWMQVITVIVTNLAGIIMAFAILIAVIKGRFDVLSEKLDGHLKNMVDALKDSKRVEGKVEALIANPPVKTEVILDRRTKNGEKE